MVQDAKRDIETLRESLGETREELAEFRGEVKTTLSNQQQSLNRIERRQIERDDFRRGGGRAWMLTGAGWLFGLVVLAIGWLRDTITN